MDKEAKLPPGYKHGRNRVFATTSLVATRVQLSVLSTIDYYCLGVLAIVGVVVRFYNLKTPNKTVFDEIHFGSFAREYYHGEFFLDVHPPLVKLIYYWLACLGNYNGEFEFKEIGDQYDENVPYILMRSFPAICGVLTVLVTYLTLRKSSCRPIVALFGSALVLFENSMITQSRLILLDSLLVLGVAICVYGVKRNQVETPFTRPWYKSLVIIGWGLGLSVSTKFTGLFTAAWVGSVTIFQLWKYLGDMEVSDLQWCSHVFARVVTLIVLPLAMYLGIFVVHFACLPYGGSASGAFSPDFQATLIGNEKLAQQPVDVSFGSTIRIRHLNLESYLHSHEFPYKTGSKEQQVTLYSFNNDFNNDWIIETVNKNYEGVAQRSFKPIMNGQAVRLFHKATGKYLHVNDIRPPASEHDYANEVSCNGTRDLLADINYEFSVKIVDKRPNSVDDWAKSKLRSTESVFQLVHRGTRCVVMAHATKLPDWGFGQNEVLCVDEPTIPNTLWYIESNSHPLIDDDASYPRVVLAQYGFWKKFWEYHKAMFRLNNGLTDDHVYASRPESWPFLSKGINFFSAPDSHIYLLGNVAVYYVGFFLVSLVMAKQVFYILYHLNPFIVPYEPLTTSLFYQTSLEFVLGWGFHYFPSFHMDRQLFLHHYLTPLYFSTLLIPIYIDYQITKRKYVGYVLMVVIATSTLYCFWRFTPIIYGSKWTQYDCQTSKWLPGWDFNCVAYSEYSK